MKNDSSRADAAVKSISMLLCQTPLIKSQLPFHATISYFIDTRLSHEEGNEFVESEEYPYNFLEAPFATGK
jgi:hypothetical protein